MHACYFLIQQSWKNSLLYLQQHITLFTLVIHATKYVQKYIGHDDLNWAEN